MSRVIAVANQKGGCGKTIVSVNLAAALARAGDSVLLVDMDPQGHAGLSCGVDVDRLGGSMYDVLSPDHGWELDQVIVPTSGGFDLAPSNVALAAIEQELAGRPGREARLTEALGGARERYDFILIDCPPSLGLLTFNALRASDEVLIPVEPSVLSLQGLERLRDLLRVMEEHLGHSPEARAVVTMYDGRTSFARRTALELQERLGRNVFVTPIRYSVRVKEAAAAGSPLLITAPSSRAAWDFICLASELRRGIGKTPRTSSMPKTAAESRIRLTALPRPAPAAGGSRFGPRVRGGSVILSRFAPAAREVYVAGDFNDWRPTELYALRRRKDGSWYIKLDLAPGEYQYKYIVDGRWEADPHNPEVVDSDVGGLNSLLLVPETEEG